MSLGRRRWRLWACLAAACLAAAVWWWGFRVRLPDVPSPSFDPGADPTLVADLTAARNGVLKDPRSAEAWGEYGLYLRANEFHPEADVCFRAAAALDPSDGRWPYLLGCHLAETDPGAAVEWLRKADAATLPEGAKEAVRLRLVETLLKAERTDEARSALGAVDPKSPRACLVAARVAVAEGDDHRAVELLSDLATSPMAGRQVLTLLAQIYQRQGRPAFAELTSRRAAAAPDAPWPDPINDLVARHARTRAGRLDEAARYLREGLPAAAEQVLRPLTVNSPDAKPFLGLAEALEARGDRAGAVQALKDGLRVAPRDVSVNYQLGRMCFADGEQLARRGATGHAEAAFREAVKWFDAALAVDPEFGKALLLKGVALQRFLGRPEEGVALIRQFVRRRPEVGEGHLLLGQALAAMKQPAAARESLLRAAELAAPGDRRAAESLAELDKRSGGTR